MTDTCAVFFQAGACDLECAGQALAKTGLAVSKGDGFLRVGRPGAPTYRVRLSTEPHVQVEAAEIAGLWLPSTPELDVKSAFARQASDEMQHYELICRRLEELGESAAELEQEHSALYSYLTTLHGSVERVAISTCLGSQ